MNLVEESAPPSSATREFQEKLMVSMEEYFTVLTDTQRVELIGRLASNFCLYCGCKSISRSWCQCNNDE